MEQELTLRIILEAPTTGVDFGLQKGSGNDYETEQKQRSAGKDLAFEFPLKLKNASTGEDSPVFLGKYAQGPSNNRFIYIDIGTYAGQKDSLWQRRLKVPLVGITSKITRQMLADKTLILETRVAGTSKDGSPNCATVKPFAGWKLNKL
ncbi:MAG: DUF5990 family protein [Ferruginibacter sp.]